MLRLALPSAPSARLVSMPSRDIYSRIIVVDTEAEKSPIDGDTALLDEMKRAAENAGRRPEYLVAESQGTVDRRYGGDWNHVWR